MIHTRTNGPVETNHFHIMFSQWKRFLACKTTLLFPTEVRQTFFLHFTLFNVSKNVRIFYSLLHFIHFLCLLSHKFEISQVTFLSWFYFYFVNFYSRKTKQFPVQKQEKKKSRCIDYMQFNLILASNTIFFLSLSWQDNSNGDGLILLLWHKTFTLSVHKKSSIDCHKTVQQIQFHLIFLCFVSIFGDW